MNSRRVLAVLAVAELLAMAPWFSASAVAPTLARVLGASVPSSSVGRVLSEAFAE